MKVRPELFQKARLLRTAALALALAVLAVGCTGKKIDLDMPGSYLFIHKVWTQGSEMTPVYEKQDVTGKLLAQIPSGSCVLSLGGDEKWQHCCVGGIEGWIPTQYISKLAAVPGENQPLPGFLPSELQLLYARAFSAFEAYSVHVEHEQGRPGFPNWQTDQSECIYTSLSGLESGLSRLFTDECINRDFVLLGDNSQWQEQDGKLMGKMMNRGSWQAELVDFTLIEKTEDRILFDVNYHFGTTGSWNCSMPIELVHTPHGWRFNQFSTTGDDVRWMQAMGEGFDVYEAMGYVTQCEYDDAGRIYKETVTAPDGSSHMSIFDENGNEAEGASYDASGKFSYGQHSVFDENGQPVKQVTVTAMGEFYELTRLESENGFLNIRQRETYDGKTKVLLSYDQLEYNSKGRVKECRSYTGDGQLQGSFEYAYEGDWQTMELERDAQGNEIRRSETQYKNNLRSEDRRYTNGVITDRYCYNEKGCQIRSELYHDGQLYSYALSEYDDAFREIQCTEYYADGTQFFRHTRAYNAQGCIISEAIYGENDVPSQKEEFIFWPDGAQKQSTITSFDNEGNLKFVRWEEFNELGQNIKNSWFDENGELIGWEEYTYDDQGNGLTRSEYDAKGNLAGTYDYNEPVG